MEQILKTIIALCSVGLIASLFSFTGFSFTKAEAIQDEAKRLTVHKFDLVGEKLFNCGQPYSGHFEGRGYYSYPADTLDLECKTKGSTVNFFVQALEVPNRLVIKRNGNTIAFSQWLGCTTDYGPWGGPFCNTESTTLSFTKTNGIYTLHIETLTSTQTDAWEAY
ncbi:hypothetical protein [Flavilitoribacter nigricans]|uniref:Uncharacterized protein n=1 Tax=Flavilitoribacter nigricans (strain ATCC 23147 / DSM 23189 / NBRC 102662 / NCIMB 1420 / SS-2) TaxID=1122177 RepID=A0A2D0N0I1_FLAN2|nr:hypothetical protein [Flavilitoribacter nigricans]PHN01223.1 hypothetical protein CRP01_38100 [Flavilitoribacter nigricans DSM 23189 = NBRC 102662]